MSETYFLKQTHHSVSQNLFCLIMSEILLLCCIKKQDFYLLFLKELFIAVRCILPTCYRGGSLSLGMFLWGLCPGGSVCRGISVQGVFSGGTYVLGGLKYLTFGLCFTSPFSLCCSLSFSFWLIKSNISRCWTVRNIWIQISFFHNVINWFFCNTAICTNPNVYWSTYPWILQQIPWKLLH